MPYARPEDGTWVQRGFEAGDDDNRRETVEGLNRWKSCIHRRLEFEAVALSVQRPKLPIRARREEDPQSDSACSHDFPR